MSSVGEPVCSIVIRTLNEARYLRELLESIQTQTYPTACTETLIVDSGSTDGTLEIAEAFGCRILSIRREEFSFGKSLNMGCEAAKGDVLVFVSGHCVPFDANWLWNLVRPMHDQKVAITYGRQIGGPGTRFSEHSIFEKYFPPHAMATQSPYFCNNANAALRRTCWEQRPFDETLTGLEDMHLAKQMVQSGWEVRYCPDAIVYHHHQERWRQVLRRYKREAIALQKVMPEVHVYWHDAFRYFVAGVLQDFSRALSHRCLWVRMGEILTFRFCQYFGAWRGNHVHRRLSRHEKEKYFFP